MGDARYPIYDTLQISLYTLFSNPVLALPAIEERGGVAQV